MSPAILGFFTGCFWFALFLVAQLAIFRCYKKVKRSAVLLRGIATAIGGGVLTIFLLSISGKITILLAVVYFIMTIGCLFVLYGPFFYMIHTSLSVETLVLLQKNGGRLTIGELRERFVSPLFIEARLFTMVESGYLIRNANRFFATPGGTRIARVFSAIKSLWRLGPGG